MRIWIDMTAPAHVLVFRPIIPRLRQAGHEVEVTARDYAQTLELLELHGIEHTSFGRHGGASRAGKLRSLLSRTRSMRRFGRRPDFEPDERVLGLLELDREKVIVVVRPPPDVSLYHRKSNPLFPQVLTHLGSHPGVQAVVLPRTSAQREYVRELELPSVVLAEHAV